MKTANRVANAGLPLATAGLPLPTSGAPETNEAPTTNKLLRLLAVFWLLITPTGNTEGNDTVSLYRPR
jgi:hypothetical protein